MDRIDELHARIQELREDLKSHAEETEDPKGAVLCATSSEVIGGLEEAFDNYLGKSTKVWQ